MKNYLRMSLLLMLLSAVAFAAGYIFKSKKEKTNEALEYQKEYIWPSSDVEE